MSASESEKDPMTEEKYDAMVRESHSAMILRHAKRPDEPVRRMYGVPVEDMTKEELMAVIYSLVRGNENK